MQDEILAVVSLEPDGIHTGLDLERIGGIDAEVDELRHEWIHVAAGMEMHFDPFGVSPVGGTFLNRFEQCAIGVNGKELAVLRDLAFAETPFMNAY
jgi:hypothetical protein